ncbi:DNA glycosylase AlkZ-like family protein [Georgenia subflava]|uniref:Winged helix-turn-helix domain-containing protein n=1 Tax=Georgenia subflava TaxID=1622177 RepID=A0A6N7ECL8_9MICO|nr:crosslink repair DNA glycosylase YcaQ family protein [Georgenia subflava]MPV35839.1 winged helix-turn-helix domain-containing protein [Georgenia subflava]
MAVHTLDQDEARRIAVRAQLLDAQRPPDLLTVANRLTFLQLDPTAAVAPSADLVAWTRLGGGYDPAQLQQALDRDRTLFEYRATARPTADLHLYVADMQRAPRYQQTREWLQANESFRDDVLARLRDSGPLLSRDIPDTSAVPWPSTGWSNDRNVTQMLEILGGRGVVAVAGRQGRQRVWDLAERVYPADVVATPLDEALKERDRRRLKALGIARAATTAQSVEPADVGEAGEPAVVDGVKGEWRVDPEALDAPFTGRTALLSPFDRLVHDRNRAQDLFDFEYYLEMYKPRDKRRWGYFALPVLHHDRLVGKLDATADRKKRTLTVHAVHQDVRFTRAMTHDVDGEIEALATWLDLSLSRSGR